MQDPLEPLRSAPSASGILLDFDGTLSPIVEIPSEAKPLAGVVDLLQRLAARYRAVSVVSGRSAQQLLEWLGTGLDIWGVHGAERVIDGRVQRSALAAPHENLMSSVLSDARAAVADLGVPGVLVEDKRVVVVLHYRAASDPSAGAAIARVADEIASRHGLTTAAGRLAIELRPPMRLSKGDVVAQIVREKELRNALFAGDDVVDLPGFDALDDLVAAGGYGVRVGVRSDESPPDLLRRADVVVEGPTGMVQLLERLL